MSTNPRRRARVRRRLAAVAFLSNISLDGKADHLSKTSSQTKCDPSQQKTNQETRKRTSRRSRRHKIDNENDSKGDKSGSENASNSSKISAQSIGYTKAGQTGRKKPLSTDSSNQHAQSHRSRVSSRSSRTSDRTNVCDTSIEPAVTRTINAPCYEGSRQRSRDRVRNKRIVLTSGKRAPVAIFSSLIKIHHNASSSNKNNNNDSNIDRAASTSHHSKNDSCIIGKRCGSGSHRRQNTSLRQSPKSAGPQLGQVHQQSSLDQRIIIHSDSADLFALMGLEKPSSHDVSYGSIFLRPIRQDRALALQQQHSSGSQNTNDLTRLPTSTGYSIANTRPQSHYLPVIGFKTTTYCGCFQRHKQVFDSTASTNNYGSSTQISFDPTQQPYNANLLDDPDLVVGRHSTVLAFPSYITSVIDHVKPVDMKKELNEKFKARYPKLQLTLSKLRSIKRELYQIGRVDLQLDYLVVAQAYVYFEKLCLKHLITKQNRKHCAGASLLISAKLNDIKGNELKSVIEHIEASFRLKRRDLITMEFGVIIALEFALHLQPSEVMTHYERLIVEA